MSARRLLRVLAVAAAAAVGAYLGVRLLFAAACILAGHNFTEEIYAAWGAIVFTIAFGAMAAFYAIQDA